MSWSLSRLGCYDQCPLKYKFRYLLKIPQGEKGAAASRGVMLHKAVEDFVGGTLNTLPTEIDFYTGFLLNLRGHGDAEYKVALDQKWRPVEWDSKEVWLKAVLDYRITETPAKSTVFDWKSGKIYPEHDDQKHLYSLTEFARLPELIEVDAVHVYIDLKKQSKKTYRREWAEEGQRRWERKVETMESDTQHIPNPTYLCRFCEFSRAKGGPCRF